MNNQSFFHENDGVFESSNAASFSLIPITWTFSDGSKSASSSATSVVFVAVVVVVSSGSCGSAIIFGGS